MYKYAVFSPFVSLPSGTSLDDEGAPYFELNFKAAKNEEVRTPGAVPDCYCTFTFLVK